MCQPANDNSMSRTDTNHSRNAPRSARHLSLGFGFWIVCVTVYVMFATLAVNAYVAVVADANVNGRVWTSIDGSQNWTMSVQTYSPLFNAYLLDLQHAMTVGALGNFVNYVSNSSMRTATWMQTFDWSNSSSMAQAPSSAFIYIQSWQVTYSDGSVQYLNFRPNGSFVQYNPNTFFAADASVTDSSQPSVTLLSKNELSNSSTLSTSLTSLRSAASGAANLFSAISDAHQITLADHDRIFAAAIAEQQTRQRLWSHFQSRMTAPDRASHVFDRAVRSPLEFDVYRHERLNNTAAVLNVTLTTQVHIASEAERDLALQRIAGLASVWSDQRVDHARRTNFPNRQPAQAPVVASTSSKSAATSFIDNSHATAQQVSNSSSSSKESLLQAGAGPVPPVQVGPAVNFTILALRPQFDIISAVFITPKFGVGVGLIGQMTMTKLGGAYWEYCPSPTLYDLFTIDSPNCMSLDLSLPVPASAIALAKSNLANNKPMWSPYFIPNNIVTVTVQDMRATPSRVCGAMWVMGGSVGLVWVSFDYRATWTLTPLPGKYVQMNVYSAKVLNVYGRMLLVGSQGAILLGRELFSDPVSTWSTQQKFKYANATALLASKIEWNPITFPLKTELRNQDWLTIAVGCGGTIIVSGRASLIVRSADAGETWDVLSPSAETNSFMALPLLPRRPFSAPPLPKSLWTVLDLVLLSQGKTPDQVLALERDFNEDDLTLLDADYARERVRVLDDRARISDIISTGLPANTEAATESASSAIRLAAASAAATELSALGERQKALLGAAYWEVHFDRVEAHHARLEALVVEQKQPIWKRALAWTRSSMIAVSRRMRSLWHRFVGVNDTASVDGADGSSNSTRHAIDVSVSSARSRILAEDGTFLESFTVQSERSDFSLRMVPIAMVRAPSGSTANGAPHKSEAQPHARQLLQAGNSSAGGTSAGGGSGLPISYPTLEPNTPVTQTTQAFSSISLTPIQKWGVALSGPNMYETDDCGNSWRRMNLPVNAAVIGSPKPSLRSVAIVEAPVFVVDTNLSTHAVYLSEGLIVFNHRVTNIGSVPLTVQNLNSTLRAPPPLGFPDIYVHTSSPSGFQDEVIAPGAVKDFILYVNCSDPKTYPVSGTGSFTTLDWAFLHNGPLPNTYFPMQIRFKIVLDPPRPYIPSWFEANQNFFVTLSGGIWIGMFLFFLIRRSYLFSAPLLRPDRLALHFNWLTSSLYIGLMVDPDTEARDREFDKLREATEADSKRRAREERAKKQLRLTSGGHDGSSGGSVNITALLGLEPNKRGTSREGALVATSGGPHQPDNSPFRSDGDNGDTDEAETESALASVDISKINLAVATSFSPTDRRLSLLAQMETFNTDPRVKLLDRIRIIRSPGDHLLKLMERDPRAIDENGEIVDKHAWARRLAERKLVIRRKNNMETGAAQGMQAARLTQGDTAAAAAEAEAHALMLAEQEKLKAQRSLQLQQQQQQHLQLQYQQSSVRQHSDKDALLSKRSDDTDEDDSEVDVQGDFVDVDAMMRSDRVNSMKSRRRMPVVPALTLSNSSSTAAGAVKKRPPPPIAKAPAPPIVAVSANASLFAGKGRAPPTVAEASRLEKELKSSARRPSEWRDATTKSGQATVEMPGHKAPHAKSQSFEPVQYPMPSSLLASTAQRPGVSMPPLAKLVSMSTAQAAPVAPATPAAATKPLHKRAVSIAQQAIAALAADQQASVKSSFDAFSAAGDEGDDDEPPPPSDFAPMKKGDVTVPAGWLASQSSGMGLRAMATMAHANAAGTGPLVAATDDGARISVSALAAQRASHAQRAGVASAGGAPASETPLALRKINSLLKK